MFSDKNTWLRTSESDVDETNVIASPLVPNLPALPTYEKQQPKAIEGAQIQFQTSDDTN